MRLYRVVYEIDFEAESALEAAFEAVACMQDPDSLPPEVLVVEWTEGADSGEVLSASARNRAIRFDFSESMDAIPR